MIRVKAVPRLAGMACECRAIAVGTSRFHLLCLLLLSVTVLAGVNVFVHLWYAATTTSTVNANQSRIEDRMV